MEQAPPLAVCVSQRYSLRRSVVHHVRASFLPVLQYFFCGPGDPVTPSLGAIRFATETDEITGIVDSPTGSTKVGIGPMVSKLELLTSR